ncbi:hypothetical protein LR032_01140 [Candidatus Bipolaricaulota bacterium]|nr:hypothetical protein [Candidatus Bipolaricaulota bacterium]
MTLCSIECYASSQQHCLSVARDDRSSPWTAWDAEWGLGAALAWWGLSFAVPIVHAEILQHRVVGWLALMLLRALLSPDALLTRRWVHLAAGLVLFLLALLVAEYKRSWSRRP